MRRNGGLAALLACGLIAFAVVTGADGQARGAILDPAKGPTGTTEAWQPSMATPAVAAGGTDTPADGAVSCASTGYCAMVGPYAPGGPASVNSVISGWIWSKINGVWGRPKQIPGLPALNKGGLADPIAISCASTGNCAVGGWYLSASVDGAVDPFVVTESKGAWRNAQAIPGAGKLNAGGSAVVDLVSCGAPGDCTAVGTYLDRDEHTGWFGVTQRGGTWGAAVPLPSVTALGDVAIDSLACPTSGNCAAVGDSGSDKVAFTLNEAGGRWGKATRVLGTSAGRAGLSHVSCPSTGNCVAVGTYTPKRNARPAAMRVTEVSGRWGSAHTLPLAGDPVAWSVSCPANGSCTVASTGHIVSEVHGSWGKTQAGPAGYQVNSLSCTRIGYCSAAAYYSHSSASSSESAIGVSDQAAGSWGPWNLLPGTIITGDPNGSATVSPVSCGGPGNCALYGYLEDAQAGPFGQFAAGKRSEPVTATALVLSAAHLTYGHEQAERLSVAVLAAAGTPSGAVTVTAGPRTLCTMRLAAGKGHCSLGAKTLPAGTYKLAGYYGINAGFAASHSGAAALVVSR